MIKILYRNLTVITVITFSSVMLASCKKESVSIKTELQTYTGNLKFEFLPQSIEKVFSSQATWEARALAYFNIIKEETDWCMFYYSLAYNQLEFDGSFCLAKSFDGDTWSRTLINNNTNILIRGYDKKGITGNFVFIDSFDTQFRYKLICGKLVNDEQKTFLYASADGVKWKMVKQLFNLMQDSQFSAICMNGKYYVFSRFNDYTGKFQRAIGLSLLDKNFNVIQQPGLLLEAQPNDPFPHIYNSAASKINDSSVLFFPTYYDDDNGIQIKLLYTNNMKDYYLVNNNINKELFPGGGVRWAIVSPGLIPTQDRNTYWLYYYGTKAKHNDFAVSRKIDVSYYRIKLVIH